jgi:hypothetical protein
MLPAIIAAIGLAAQIGSSIYSNWKSAEANKKMQATSDAAHAQQNAEAEQLKVSEGDFMNTALGKNMIENLRRQYSDAVKRDVSGGLKSGRTDEQKLAASSNLNDAYARNLAHIAAVGTQYRGHILSQAQELKNAARNRKYSADMSLLNAENQSALNIADNGQKIGSGLINAAGSFDGKKTTTTAPSITSPPVNNSEIISKNVFGNPDLIEYYKLQQQKTLENNPFKNYSKPFNINLL